VTKFWLAIVNELTVLDGLLCYDIPKIDLKFSIYWF